MKRLLVLILSLAALLPSCGNGGSIQTTPASAVTLAITPTTASVPAGATLQFMATVANTSDTVVTWQVNGTAGGGPTLGTISSSGLYAAPATVPNPATITVTAVSQADTSVSASASVTITAKASIGISPSSVTVLAGATQQFTSIVTGMSNTAVNWQVNGMTGGNSTLGTISTAGLYTAPATPPSGRTVNVTAVSQADPSMSASASVSIAPSVATLSGQYAFSFSGQNSLGLLTAAGSFQADGKGNVLNGVEDVNSGAGVFTSVPFTGTYSVGEDGLGSLTLSSSLGPQNFELVVTSNTYARLIRFDTFATGTGNLEMQDLSAFATSALNGEFVVKIDGIDSSSAPLSSIGLLTLDGIGDVSSGLLDANDDGSVTLNNPVNGNYSVGSDGRGTLTVTGSLGTFDFAFYVISAEKIRLVSVDVFPVWSGLGREQQGSSFSNATLKGPVVFAAGGTSSAGGLDDAGVFVSTTTGTILDGVGDENSDGTIISGYPFTGNYSISPNGHGSLTLVSTSVGTADYSFYLETSSQAVLLRTDSSAVTSGTMTEQAQASFSSASVNGAFGFGADGLFSGGSIDKLGQFTANGSGSASGTEDVNGAGALNPSLALSDTYSVASNGRGTLNVTAGGDSRVLNFYLVSPNQMLLIGLDSDQVLLGQGDQQFK